MALRTTRNTSVGTHETPEFSYLKVSMGKFLSDMNSTLSTFSSQSDGLSSPRLISQPRLVGGSNREPALSSHPCLSAVSV